MTSQTCLYFAYGSNMNPSRMESRVPGARFVGRATLRGWRLVERLYADIEKSRGGRVEGVLYLLTPGELRRLDLCEGYPDCYGCGRVIVHAELGGSRSVRYRVPAYAYYMTARTRGERDGVPYPESYRRICAEGARHWGIPNAFSARRSEARTPRTQAAAMPERNGEIFRYPVANLDGLRHHM